jgi:hypothetical protein
MKTKVIAHRLGDIIRKENNNIKKPDDIGTKPIPNWTRNKNKKDEIKKSYSEIMMENIKNEFERYVMEQEMKIQNRTII